jgi:hypothetical protein
MAGYKPIAIIIRTGEAGKLPTLGQNVPSAPDGPGLQFASAFALRHNGPSQKRDPLSAADRNKPYNQSFVEK